VPVQVDERAVVDFGTIYGGDPAGVTVLTYADTAMFTGGDPDPGFDGDDEVVFMSKEAGLRSQAPAEPASVIAGSGLEIAVIDPLAPGDTAFLYIFEGDGTLDPSAGAPDIPYVFNLLSGDYKTTYNTESGPNPEDSGVETSAYGVHFLDRWVRDETWVNAGGATGVDILDRHKNLFRPGDCGRSEDTFSGGEGAFIVNRTGPVRALRGYVGANSGPTTYRINTFYEEREDIFTALRVHAIKGIMDFFDYSPGAAGMAYYNDLNPSSVTVDGVPDAVVQGPVVWEMITGVQGTLAMSSLLYSDIPDLDYTSYYSDDSTPSTTQCTGDDYEYGASGLWVNEEIPNTDPYLGPYYVFEGTRVIAYAAPGQDAAFAGQCAAEATSPLTVSVSPYRPGADAGAAAADETAIDAIEFKVEPNPARSSIRICLILHMTLHVDVQFYDVRGRRVMGLLSESLPAGVHRAECDIAHLPSGIYFVRASTPLGAVRAVRVIHLK
jgi:hypothetical protein